MAFFNIRSKKKMMALIGICLSTGVAMNVLGAGSMLTITQEASIAPMPDASGKYLLKSDGYYCLDQNGTQSTIPEVHFFEDFHIGDDVLNGYYYHGPNATFATEGNPVVYLNKIQTKLGEDVEPVIFDGLYLLNENGLLDAEPQVRYMDNLNANGQIYNGYYFFDETGRMDTSAGIHELHMDCHEKQFDGLYYFGGANGVLPSESGETANGIQYDDEGKITNIDSFTMQNLRKQLRAEVLPMAGVWSFYVKNLDTNEYIVFNNRALYSASLIKAFAMEASYNNMKNMYANAAKKLNTDPDSDAAVSRVATLLTNMITISDNESFNEIVRLNSENNDFCEGAECINEYLEALGYEHTLVQHTLAPSASAEQSLGGRNLTSVGDCGRLLERIYDGDCVNEEASEAMLGLLGAQKLRNKIPAGIKGPATIANKTGETNEDQHDIAIVQTPSTNYIVCIMSENCPEGNAVPLIQKMSGMIYEYMDIYAMAYSYSKH